MEIGNIRTARKGEIPHFYAMEDIKANEALVDHGRRMIENNMRRSIHPAYGVDMAKPGAEHTVMIEIDMRGGFGDPLMDALRRDAPRRQAMLQEMRRKRTRPFRIAVWFTVIALGLLAVGLYYGVAHADTITYIAPDRPAVVQTPALVTAYTSSRDETDSTPFETASGTHTHDGTLACPAKYPFGTKVQIAGQMYTCEDRMNARFAADEHFDMWVHTKAEAFAWGAQNINVVIEK